MLKNKNIYTEKLERLLEKPFIIDIIFVLGTIFSIFTKTIYLQYTIKLKEPPFSLLNYVSVYIFDYCYYGLVCALWVPKRYKGVLLTFNILIYITLVIPSMVDTMVFH